MALLKKFLYDRIIDLADAREGDIASRYDKAEEKQEAAQAAAQKYEQKRAEIEEKQEKLLSEARQEAEEERHVLVESARAQVDEKKSKWLEALQQEQETFLRRLAAETGTQVYETTRRVLADLADVDVERRVVDVFVHRLRSLHGEQREQLVQKLPQAETAVVHSAFDLSDDNRQTIINTIHNEFADVPLIFERKPELICGLALRVNGRQLVWNVDSYLDTLTERTETLLHEELAKSSETESKAEAAHDS